MAPFPLLVGLSGVATRRAASGSVRSSYAVLISGTRYRATLPHRGARRRCREAAKRNDNSLERRERVVGLRNQPRASIARSTRKSSSTRVSFQDLERRFRACNVGDKSCQFSQAYVIAYETASSNQLGVLPRVQRRNAEQIRSTKSRSPRGTAARKQ